MLRIVMTAGRMNHLLSGMQIPIDDVFDADENG
jgi:hypothetical protein